MADVIGVHFDSDTRLESDEEPILTSEEPPKRSKFKLTVEIPGLLITFAASFTGGVTSNLLLYRTCLVDLGYNASTCDLLQARNKSEEAQALETEVQAHLTFLLMTISLYGGIVPAILSIFLGAWSDKHGRKPLVVWPALGLFISSTLTTIYTAIPTLGAWWSLPCIIPLALFGGFSTFGLGTCLLVTDLSDEASRAFRLAIIEGILFIGLVLGTISSGYTFEAIGFFYMYLISTVMYFIGMIYIIFFVDESLNGAEKPLLRTLINSSTLRDMAKTCTKRRNTSIAVILCLLMAAFGLATICNNGQMNMQYLFTREHFRWNLREYSIFNAVSLMFTVIGLSLGLMFFQKVCKMNEGVLLILSFISSIADSTLKGFAVMPWQFYFAAATSLLGGLSAPLVRSLVTKIIPDNEIGKMFSLISCVEAITPLIAPMLYNTIYYATLTTFPGTIYLVSSGFFTIGLIFVIIAEVLSHRLRSNPGYTDLINEVSEPTN